MKELQRKQLMKRRMYSLPVIIVLFIAAGFMIRGTIRIMGKENESTRNLKNVEEKAAILSSRSLELRENIDRLNTDEGIIEEIREKFNVSEKGERVALIVEESTKDEDDAALESHWYDNIWFKIRNLWQD